jgi:ribosome biogenesis GTPase A
MENPKINLIIFGENASMDIHNIININMSLDKNSEYDCQKFIDKNGKMDFFIFQNKFEDKTIDKTFKNIEKMLNDHYKEELNIKFEGQNSTQKRKLIRDVLIFIVDKLEDKNTEKIVKKFEKYSYTPSKQPFMLFLTKQENNPDIESLWGSITNSNLDKRNLFALKFPQNYTDKEEILNLLNYFFDYYHECYLSKNNFASLNLLICGIAEAGKSTLINQIQKKKLQKKDMAYQKVQKLSFILIMIIILI